VPDPAACDHIRARSVRDAARRGGFPQRPRTSTAVLRTRAETVRPLDVYRTCSARRLRRVRLNPHTGGRGYLSVCGAIRDGLNHHHTPRLPQVRADRGDRGGHRRALGRRGRAASKHGYHTRVDQPSNCSASAGCTENPARTDPGALAEANPAYSDRVERLIPDGWPTAPRSNPVLFVPGRGRRSRCWSTIGMMSRRPDPHGPGQRRPSEQFAFVTIAAADRLRADPRH